MTHGPTNPWSKSNNPSLQQNQSVSQTSDRQRQRHSAKHVGNLAHSPLAHAHGRSGKTYRRNRFCVLGPACRTIIRGR
jgi:hypothetical protein